FVRQTPISDGGNRPWMVQIADFNNDGKQDVVVTNIGESKLAATGRNITLFKGDNTGALTQWNQIQFVTNQGDNSADLPMAVVAAKFTADAFPDLVVTFANVTAINDTTAVFG